MTVLTFNPPVADQAPETWTGRAVCCVCGIQIIQSAVEVSMRVHDATFCLECASTLTTDEIARAAQEVALRGVPLS